MVASVRLSVYGNVGLVRGYCERCDTMALVLDGVIQCCDQRVEAAPKKWERIVEPEFKRDKPSAAEQRACLWRQANCCLYCELPFGEYVHRHGKPKKLYVRWDHFVPFSYSANNSDANFVAACQICNGIKSDKLFDSLEEAKVYIATVREAKGTTAA